MKALYAAVFILLSQQTGAAVYKCTSESGAVSFQGMPCAKQEKAEEIKVNVSSSNRIEEWELITRIDRIKKEKNCVIQSPTAYLGRQSGDFLFARVRTVLDADGKYVVGIYSDESFGKDGNIFHNDISGLGIRVDDNDFVPVSVNANQHVLAFDHEASDALVHEFENGKKMSFRVRYWPYDETFDGVDVPLDTFPRALRQLKECESAPSTN